MQAHNLDGQRGEQHIAPDALVFEEFGDEPAETEFLFFRGKAGDFFCLPRRRSGLAGYEDQVGFEPGCSLFKGNGFRRLRAGTEVKNLLAIGLEDKDGEKRRNFGVEGFRSCVPCWCFP